MGVDPGGQIWCKQIQGQFHYEAHTEADDSRSYMFREVNLQRPMVLLFLDAHQSIHPMSQYASPVLGI